jgi:two-component system, OmpR family, osmolarity sensor histidine kinase EnvZ
MMRWLPATTFGRLTVLIAGVVLLLVLIVLVALRSFGVGAGASAYSDLVIGNVELAQSLPRGTLPGNLRRVAQLPPGSQPALLPGQLIIAQGSRRHFGATTEVRFTDSGDVWTWVRPAGGDANWIGVRVPPFLAKTLTSGLVLLMLGAISVVWIAWRFARQITRPLEQLAAAGTRLAAGDDIPPLDGQRAPREVLALRAALAAAAAEVRRAGQERELLLAGVSHDLRTPLARLRLALELEDTVGDDDRGLMVADIEEMDRIVGQFLDYVRAGRDEATVYGDLAGLLSDLAGASSRLGFAWQIDAGTIARDWPMKPVALRRALANLMRNAELHGRPPFRLQLLFDASAAWIIVRDGGDGIPAAMREHIGDPFVRGDALSAANGTGLGLSLVHRVALAHGGELLLSGLDEPGFTARLRLPSGP